jgi:hypothetical protein
VDLMKYSLSQLSARAALNALIDNKTSGRVIGYL